MLVSLGIIVALVALKTFGENFECIEELEEKTYKVLLHKLVTIGTTTRPGVLVIDIGEIKPVRSESDGDLITPRKPVEELINALAERGAQSIGVDVDFSPENGHFIDKGDPGFFQRCLALSNKTQVPIYLGVFRTMDQPNRWLGDDAYSQLAAVIAVRRIVQHDQVPHWVRVQNGGRLRSLSAALAGVDINAEQTDNSRWSWARKSTAFIKLPSGIESRETTIDYASLPWISAEVLPVFDAENYAKLDDKIRNRMVILGDKKPSERDLFETAAGRLPGVYVHACAANTIAREPLYRLTLLGRVAVDLVLALAIFLLVKICSFLGSVFGRRRAHEDLWNTLFTLVAIALVFIVSVVFVDRTRVLWTDFVLVCLVLLVQLVVDFFRSCLNPEPQTP